MSRNYKFHNPEGAYFVSFAVVNWIDVFANEEYIEILLESLRFSQQKKGMEIYAWVVMTNHVHLVFRSIQGIKPEQLLGDFKRFTSRKIVQTIKDSSDESQKDWLLKQFHEAAQQTSNVKHHQFWRHDNHPIELWSNGVIAEKINYIHNNPVKAGIVENPEDYKWSSAKDYAGLKGVLKNVVVASI
jgi:REP element-mobilizing transposase RayT